MTISYFYFILKQEKLNNFIKFNKVLLLILTWSDYKIP